MEKVELACKIMQLAVDNNSNKVDKANAIIKATQLIEMYTTEQLILSGVSLLKKYIDHVGQCEGTDFISSCNMSYGSNVKFSDEEINILKTLS